MYLAMIKGQCHEIFTSDFSHEFTEVFTTEVDGVNDAKGNLTASVDETSGKFITGVIDTGVHIFAKLFTECSVTGAKCITTPAGDTMAGVGGKLSAVSPTLVSQQGQQNQSYTLIY
jgi:hypothetical protein